MIGGKQARRRRELARGIARSGLTAVAHTHPQIPSFGISLSTGMMEQLKALGEPGQFILGLVAGYTPEETRASQRFAEEHQGKTWLDTDRIAPA